MLDEPQHNLAKL